MCKFVQKCINCDAVVDYTEAMLRDVLCRGMEDSEIQLDLLGDKNQDMTLEQMLRFIEAKEAGKRSATQLLLPHATDAITGSAYKHHSGEATAKGARSLFILWKVRSWQGCTCTPETQRVPSICGHCRKDHH